MALLGLIIVCEACVTGGSSRDEDFASSRSLKEADQFFNQEEYRTALAQYSAYLYSPFLNKKEMPYARYKVGLCHYMIGQYDDALQTLEILVKESPDAPFVPQARELMQKCQNQINQRNQQLAGEQKDLQQKIVQYEEFVKSNPDNAEYHFQLGGYYWDYGRYQDAVAEYGKASQLNPAYLQQDVLRQRVRITDNGEFVVRNPLLEFNKMDPVQVQAKMERVERSNWLGTTESLRVSGVVENTGLRDVHNLNLEISIYDFNDTVQDTRMANIGTLIAGGKRDFAVMMTRYSGWGVDIRKFTAKVFYDEQR